MQDPEGQVKQLVVQTGSHACVTQGHYPIPPSLRLDLAPHKRVIPGPQRQNLEWPEPWSGRTHLWTHHGAAHLMLMGHGPALFSDLLWVVEWALPVTVCLRAGLESLCSSPRWADKGCFPQGVPRVAELWPHVPFLTSDPLKPQYPQMRRLQLRKLTALLGVPESSWESRV